MAVSVPNIHNKEDVYIEKSHLPVYLFRCGILLSKTVLKLLRASLLAPQGGLAEPQPAARSYRLGVLLSKPFMTVLFSPSRLGIRQSRWGT